MKKFLLLPIFLILALYPRLAEATTEEDWFGFLEEPLGKMEMKGTFLENDLLLIEVVAKEMQKPILGTAFHLKYPADKLKFLKYEPGDFLERGGDPIYLVTDKGAEIIFGQTLKREDSFPVGNGVVTKFYFETHGAKDFLLEFENGVVSTMETVRQDLYMIKWFNLHIDEKKQTLISQDDELDFLNEVRSDSGDQGMKKTSGGKITALLSGMLALVIGLGIYFIHKFSGQKRTT